MTPVLFLKAIANQAGYYLSGSPPRWHKWSADNPPPKNAKEVVTGDIPYRHAVLRREEPLDEISNQGIPYVRNRDKGTWHQRTPESRPETKNVALIMSALAGHDVAPSHFDGTPNYERLRLAGEYGGGSKQAQLLDLLFPVGKGKSPGARPNQNGDLRNLNGYAYILNDGHWQDAGEDNIIPPGKPSTEYRKTEVTLRKSELNKDPVTYRLYQEGWYNQDQTSFLDGADAVIINSTVGNPVNTKALANLSRQTKDARINWYMKNPQPLGDGVVVNGETAMDALYPPSGKLDQPKARFIQGQAFRLKGDHWKMDGKQDVTEIFTTKARSSAGLTSLIG